MSDHHAPQAGAADPSASAPRAAQQAQQSVPATAPGAGTPSPRAPGYAAFGTGAGAAVAFRDLASI